MRSHTLQPDWSVRHHPSQEHLGGLRHHNVPLCPSTWASGCWGRPFYNFSTADTSVCLILGNGDSGPWCFSSWPSNFLSVPFILWLICATSTLLPPSSLWKHLPNLSVPLQPFRVITSSLYSLQKWVTCWKSHGVQISCLRFEPRSKV